MKRSQTYYLNRKLLKGLEYDNCSFRPTIKDVEEWFDIINEQIFGNKLTRFASIKVKKLKKVHALYHYWPKKENEPSELEMHHFFKDKKFFVEILAHEMIHHFQHSCDEPLGHGPTFLSWRENLKLRGLTLYRAT